MSLQACLPGGPIQPRRLPTADQYRAQADSWRRLASTVASVLQDHSGQSQRLERDWSGPRAESFDSHANEVQDGLTQATELCEQVARRLNALADSIEFTAYDDNPRVPYPEPPSLEAVAAVDDPYGSRPVEAELIADNPDAQLSVTPEFMAERQDAASDLRRLLQTLAGLTDTWRGRGLDGDPGWDVPKDNLVGVRQTSYGHTTVITTGDSDDRVTVHVDPDTSRTTVTVVDSDGAVTEKVIPPGTQVVLNTGGGDDSVRMTGAPGDHVRVVGAETVETDEEFKDRIGPGEPRSSPVDTEQPSLSARDQPIEHTLPVDPPHDGTPGGGEEHTTPVYH